jgi:signal transduction histidine kinase
MSLDEQEVYLAETAAAVQRMMTAQSIQCGVAIELMVAPDLPALRGDDQAIRQILLNLISNSLKFTGRGGRAVVAAGLDTDGALWLSVTDNGPGIDAALKDRIFDIFKTNRPEGMGLGLWLSKNIVERNKGILRCENLPAGGARFIVELPVFRG